MHKYWTSAADTALHQGQQRDLLADEDTFIDSTHLPSYSATAWQPELGEGPAPRLPDADICLQVIR